MNIYHKLALTTSSLALSLITALEFKPAVAASVNFTSDYTLGGSGSGSGSFSFADGLTTITSLDQLTDFIYTGLYTTYNLSNLLDFEYTVGNNYFLATAYSNTDEITNYVSFGLPNTVTEQQVIEGEILAIASGTQTATLATPVPEPDISASVIAGSVLFWSLRKMRSSRSIDHQISSTEIIRR